MGCPLCEHARKRGSWPVSHIGTHCDGCHRSWNGAAECHCSECHHHFSSVSVFDLHIPHCRTGDVTGTAERLRASRRKNGNPVFGVSPRRNGNVWVTWSPHGSPWAREGV